jgi:hypothetical protein
MKTTHHLWNILIHLERIVKVICYNLSNKEFGINNIEDEKNISNWIKGMAGHVVFKSLTQLVL